VSVIIPVRNDPIRLAQCLNALGDSTFRDFEVIVADDASGPETARVAEATGARVVRLDQNRGAAAARNAAAEHARGEVFFFVDADVCVHPDTIARALASLDDPNVDAVFGSYDLEPGEPNLLSQYKNLTHHYVHQHARPHASTFWTGCGAIRAGVFRAFGGFDARRFRGPSIEDIELGVRMTRAGRCILVNRDVQAKHLKRWSLRGIVVSDVRDRAVPWTRLILRMKDVPNDLNLTTSQRASAIVAATFAGTVLVACSRLPWLAIVPLLVYGAIVVVDRWTSRHRATPLLRFSAAAGICASVALATWYARWWAVVLAVPLLAIVLINARFYLFFARHRGMLFFAAVLPMQLLYYLYGGAVFAALTVAQKVAALLRRPPVAGASTNPPVNVASGS
jgi:hypothetical protein